MYFTFILTGYVVLVIGPPFPALAVSLGLPRLSSIEHHRTVRQVNPLTALCSGITNPATECSDQVTIAACPTECPAGASPGTVISACAGITDPATECLKPIPKAACPTECPAGGVPASPGAVTQGVACPTDPGWTPHTNGNCYYFSSVASTSPGVTGVVTVNWLGAKTACELIASTTGEDIALAELGNPANLRSDNWLMHQISLKGQEVWLGARVPAKANKYSNTGGENRMQSWRGSGVEPPAGPPEADVYNWLRGDRVLAIHDIYWGPKQPNNANREQQNCLSTIDNEGTHGRHYFNDENCSKEQHYVCQLF